MPENFFISYATKDAQQFALRLHDELEGDSFHAWLDKRDIRPTDNWSQAIEQGLHECVGVLVILTPAAIASTVCQNELSLAHTLKKPLLPILITPETPDAQPLAGDLIPLVLQGKQYISFVSSFEQGIAKLRPALHRILALTRSIDAKQQQIADLEQKRPDAPRPQALERAIEDLQGDISNRQRVLVDPEAYLDAYRQSTETEIESIRQSRKRAAEDAARSTRQRIVGSPPQAVNEHFKDRSDERGHIVNALLNPDDAKRVVSIIGRGGVGKTALVVNVLRDLEKDHANVHGIAYFSAATRASTLSLERIFNSIGAMLGGDAEKVISDIWSNPNLTSETRIERLLTHLRDHRCILLFDNLEDALDTTGRVTDPDVALFLDLFLTRQHRARVLITSREPLNPSDEARALQAEYVLPLENGLPAEYAVELLRDLDPQGELGLQAADAALLKQIAAKTYGIPRALEAVVGLLATDPLLTPEALLRDRNLWHGGVTEKLVARAQSRLNADQRVVMQALALFGRPVREAAVRYLLEPFAEIGLDVSTTLRQLGRGRYITINRSTGEITIHPLDKEYNYRQIADHRSNGAPVMVVVLVEVTDWETRAADYYETMRGDPADWKEYADLAPILAEFEHRVRAGDYQTALYLVSTIGYNYLRLWGYSAKELELREQLVGRLADERSEVINTNEMGHLYSDLAHYRKALRAYEEVLPVVQGLGDRVWEGRVRGAIGSTHWSLQNYDAALDHLNAALAIARELDERDDEALCLHAIALVYDYQGQKGAALAGYQESLAITQQIGNERRQAATLFNISFIHQSLGQLEPAREYASRAFELFRKLKDRAGQGSSHNRLGSLDELAGRYADALAHYRQALTLAQETGNRRWHVVALADIASLYPHGVDAAEAEANLKAALILAEDIASPEMLSYVHRAYARYHLRRGAFAAALTHLEAARPHIRPDGQFSFQRNLGITHWRLGNRAGAHTAFTACLDEAAKALADTAELYDPKYARGLALAGLALITGDTTYIDDARTAYESGIANLSARGVLDDAIEDLDLLAGATHAGQVAPLRALLTTARGDHPS